MYNIIRITMKVSLKVFKFHLWTQNVDQTRNVSLENVLHYRITFSLCSAVNCLNKLNHIFSLYWFSL